MEPQSAGLWAISARIVGCSTACIGTAVRSGNIAQRPHVEQAVASLERDSVEEFAQRRATQLRAREQSRRSEERRLEARRQAQAPPGDGNVWLDATTAALLLGVARGRVGQLAQRDRLPPYTSRAGRLWFRRDHLELIAAARVRLRTALADPSRLE